MMPPATLYTPDCIFLKPTHTVVSFALRYLSQYHAVTCRKNFRLCWKPLTCACTIQAAKVRNSDAASSSTVIGTDTRRWNALPKQLYVRFSTFARTQFCHLNGGYQYSVGMSGYVTPQSATRTAIATFNRTMPLSCHAG